jgi:hypothetical protein
MATDNYIYYAVILYVIIIITLALVKPQIIYNHKQNKYREFGLNFKDIQNPDKPTPLSFSILAIIIAILMGIIFSLLYKPDNIKSLKNDNKKNKSNKHMKLAYIKKPQIKQINKMNKMNEINKINQMNQMNQMNHMNQISQMGQMVHMIMPNPQIQYIPVIMNYDSSSE